MAYPEARRTCVDICIVSISGVGKLMEQAEQLGMREYWRRVYVCDSAKRVGSPAGDSASRPPDAFCALSMSFARITATVTGNMQSFAGHPQVPFHTGLDAIYGVSLRKLILDT